MRLQIKVFLCFILIWFLFLSTVYVGAHHYLLSSLLQLESEGNQEIIIHHYAYNQIFNHYLILFVLIGLFIGGLILYIVRIVFINHLSTLQQLHHAMAVEVKKEDELYKKITLLETRAEKAAKLDAVFHTLCDLLNSIGTSLSLLQEKIENSNAERLTPLVVLLTQHEANVGSFLQNDSEGKQIPYQLTEISKMWVEENKYIVKELVLLKNHYNEIYQIIKSI